MERFIQVKCNEGLLSIEQLGELPDISLDSWLDSVGCSKLAKVSYAEKYPLKSNTLSKMLKRHKEYALRKKAQEAEEVIVHRSWKELKALRAELVRGFPGAFVPLLPKRKVKNAVGYYLDYIGQNPYFRSDISVALFLDQEVQSFQTALRKQKKAAKTKYLVCEGRFRWFQAISSHQKRRHNSFQENKEFFQHLKSEFTMALKHLEVLKQNVKKQMNLHESHAVATNEMNVSVQNLLSLEANLRHLTDTTTEELTDASSSTAKALTAQTALYCKHYGAPMLQKRLLYRIEQEISILVHWKKAVARVELKAKEFSELEKRIEGEGRDKVRKVLEKRYKENELNLAASYQGLLGIELNTFRTKRVIAMKAILKNLSEFHLLGAEKTIENWSFAGQQVTDQDLEVSDFSDSAIPLGKAHGVNRRASEDTDPLELVHFEVKDVLERKQGSGLGKRKLLKLHPGEFLVGTKTNESRIGKPETFFAVNARGERGLVYVENVVCRGLINRAQTELVPQLQTIAIEEPTQLTPDVKPQEEVKEVEEKQEEEEEEVDIGEPSLPVENSNQAVSQTSAETMPSMSTLVTTTLPVHTPPKNFLEELKGPRKVLNKVPVQEKKEPTGNSLLHELHRKLSTHRLTINGGKGEPKDETAMSQYSFQSSTRVN